ncbi:MAG: hypothetical protein NTW87_15845 [Planctomycetota bacterium]|nr:hypothetical protein [Planctomycetota bacterium]
MNWDALLGQEPAKRYLRSVLATGRRAHAYLFKGPVGVGKRTAAGIFAQALLCEQPAGKDTACGRCKACRCFLAGTHPDLIRLRKFTEAGGEVGAHEPVIRLETVQYVCEQLHRSPMMARQRVALVPEAQRLCRGQAEPANAFLKTLEEPPPAAAIILTSSQPEGLLETIVSRVQAVQFRRLAAGEVRAGLASLAAAKSETERDLAAALADGSLGQALELLTGDLRNWRAMVLSGLEKLDPREGLQFGLMLWTLADAEGKRLFQAKKESGASAADEELSPDDESGAGEGAAKTEAGWKRYVLQRLLEVCELCFRDGLVCAAVGGTLQPPQSALLLQPDQQHLAQTLARRFGDVGCQKALAAVREALLAVRLYVRGDVVGRALAGKLVEAMSTGA